MPTTIDEKYLKSRFDYDITEELRSLSKNTSASKAFLFQKVYDTLFDFIMQEDVRVTSEADMEARLSDDAKKDKFRQAQAYQLIYIMTNGDNSLIIPDDLNINAKAWDICQSTVRILRHVLKFNRPTPFTERF